MELMTPTPQPNERSRTADQAPAGGKGRPAPGPFGTPSRARMTRIERVRARRKARRIRLAVLCALVLAGVLAYFTGLYGASLSLLGDVYDSVTIALTPGPGFPAALKVTGFVSAQPFAGGLVAVGEQEAAILSAGGNEVRRIQHTYSRPAVAAGNTRLCLYNRSGTELLVESRSKNLFQQTTQDAIQLCAMSPNGTLAVFTRSALTVYDPMFTEIFRFHTSETPTAMAFARDNRQFAVACLSGTDGALGAAVYLFTTDPDAPDQATAVIQNAEGMALRIFYPDNDRVLVVYDTACALYSAADGAQLARYEYGGRQLQSAALSDGGNDLVLLFGDGAHSSQTALAVLETEALAAVGQAQVGRTARGLAASRTGAYVLTSDGALCYTLAGELFDTVTVEGRTLAAVAADSPLLVCEGQVYELPAPGRAAARKAEQAARQAQQASAAQSAAPAAEPSSVPAPAA